MNLMVFIAHVCNYTICDLQSVTSEFSTLKEDIKLTLKFSVCKYDAKQNKTRIQQSAFTY